LKLLYNGVPVLGILLLDEREREREREREKKKDGRLVNKMNKHLIT
jgi:hypothetical protein